MYAADVRRRGGDIADDLRTPIDHGDDVLEIMARDDVIAAASMERVQLRRDEQRRRDDSYVVSGDVERLGGLDCGRVPPVAEAKDCARQSA